MLVGYNGVPLAYVAVMFVYTPLLCRGMGQGGARRVLGPLAWIVKPLLASVLLGLLVARYPLPPEQSALATATITALTYVGTCWPASPRWLTVAILIQRDKYMPLKLVNGIRTAK